MIAPLQELPDFHDDAMTDEQVEILAGLERIQEQLSDLPAEQQLNPISSTSGLQFGEHVALLLNYLAMLPLVMCAEPDQDSHLINLAQVRLRIVEGAFAARVLAREKPGTLWDCDVSDELDEE